MPDAHFANLRRIARTRAELYIATFICSYISVEFTWNRVMQREATARADVDSALRGPASGNRQTLF